MHPRFGYSILKANSCVASTSPGSDLHLYCSMALRTAAWNTRGPERMVTSRTTPSRISACARTTPSMPSCSALRGISGGTCEGQTTPISVRPLAGLGAGGAGGGGGAITGGAGGGVATDAIAGAAVTGGATSGGGTKGGGGAWVTGVGSGGLIGLGGGGGGGGIMTS